ARRAVCRRLLTVSARKPAPMGWAPDVRGRGTRVCGVGPKVCPSRTRRCHGGRHFGRASCPLPGERALSSSKDTPLANRHTTCLKEARSDSGQRNPAGGAAVPRDRVAAVLTIRGAVRVACAGLLPGADDCGGSVAVLLHGHPFSLCHLPP